MPNNQPFPEYEIALLALIQKEGSPKDTRRLKTIVNELVEAEVLFESDGITIGWRLLDFDGMSLMPSWAREYLWTDERHGWAYWSALGKPYKARLFAIIECIKLEKLTQNRVPTLEVLKGGRYDKAQITK